MNKNHTFNFSDNNDRPLYEFAQQAYLNYSMYVILDRALPHIGDGLKPVQRRILYAMSELGLKATAKYKKSARTVGDVLGKFHPHGDIACYEAMVLMAQDFSYRYPLVDGQGNWGSIDNPKSFAAMRYTESRLTAYADTLLSELGQGTVNWVANFDGSLQEPKLLPARLPNILLNGTTGIAVGMATDIPPHNLGELIQACIHLLNKPSASVQDLCQYVLAPDFPTGGEIITAKAEIISIYEKGQGLIKLRAVWESEKTSVVITELPYQCSVSRIMEQIASQIKSKKLPMLEGVRDESDHENPTRVLLILRSNRVDKEALMSHLFVTTDLERSCRINLNLIGLNGQPSVKNLKTILSEWLMYRLATITRRLQFRLQEVEKLLQRIEGLLVAYSHLDQVIEIIRNSDRVKEELMATFSLSAVKAEAILELRLRKLAKLEEQALINRQQELVAEKQQLDKVLGSEQRLRTMLIKELQADMKCFMDERRSLLVSRAQAQVLKEVDIIQAEPLAVILSKNGWVRAAKGHEIDPNSLSYKHQDACLQIALGKRNQMVVFIDSSGRVYALPAHTLPSARGLGGPVSAHFTPPDGVNFVGVVMGDLSTKYLLASDSGYGFLVLFKDMITKSKNGKAILKAPEKAHVLMPILIGVVEDKWLAVISRQGYLLCFPANQLPVMVKGKGLKMMHIPVEKRRSREDYIVAVIAFCLTDTLVVTAGERHVRLKPTTLTDYRSMRAKRGKLLPRGYRHVTRLQVAD